MRSLFVTLALVILAGPVLAEDKKKDTKKPLLTQEPNVCRGLNTCKNLAKGKKNDCAGRKRINGRAKK